MFLYFLPLLTFCGNNFRLINWQKNRLLVSYLIPTLIQLINTTSFSKMFLNVVRRLLFIYFVCLHLHCCLTWTERIVNTPFGATIALFASLCPFCRLFALDFAPKIKENASPRVCIFKISRGGHGPRPPLGIACQRHARVGLWPNYLPIIVRFPPVKDLSYIPELRQNQAIFDMMK